MKTGFYVVIAKKDIFIETSRKNKTDKLCSDIFRKLVNFGFSIPDNPATRHELKYFMQPATLEIKTCSHGDYYNISGENFGGCGSFINDGQTIVFSLDE